MKSKTNYTPGTMSFMDGFNGPKEDKGFWLVADFDKAKKIVTKLLADRKKIAYVEMGFDGDWHVNHETIYEDGVFVTEYNTYSSSCWAETIIIVHYSDGTNEAFPAWKKEDKLNNNNN